MMTTELLAKLPKISSSVRDAGGLVVLRVSVKLTDKIADVSHAFMPSDLDHPRIVRVETARRLRELADFIEAAE